MDRVFDVIDKHIFMYHVLMEEYDDAFEINGYASAISALIMLKRELSGEYEY